MHFADLHTHSSASDGTLDAEQIFQRAQALDGLKAISITDHDTITPAQKVEALETVHDLYFVPGVELTTTHAGRAVHMLGYFFDSEDHELNRFTQESRNKRAERCFAMADRLHEAGFPVTSEELKRSDAFPNRPALARLLVQKGCASSFDEAFSKFLTARSPYYVECLYPETIEAISLIREAGGYAFIAHPAKYKVVDLIPELAKEGLHGLEAFHTQHTKEQSAELLLLADDLSLAISGGSDWHGDDVHGATLGGSGLDEEAFKCFLASCDHDDIS